MDTDKEQERQRYDDRARSLLSESTNTIGNYTSGVSALPGALQTPYLCYESIIRDCKVNKISTILEIGAGSGAHTRTLLETGAQVCATDISENSLEIIQKQNKGYNNLKTKTADMESLPFADNSFDIVTSAGSLSYGDNKVVMKEIYRVLKDNGLFICVDSLNHNPVYRINRWLHFLRANRTVSTLNRMPTISLIDSYEKLFGDITVYYFGAISWLTPLLRKIFDESKVTEISDRIDKLFNIKKSAFKFVMIVKKDKYE